MSVVSDLLERVSEIGNALLPGAATRDAPLEDLCERLASGRGEATGLALAGRVLDRLEAMDDAARAEAFAMLAERFGPNRARLEAAVEAWRAAPEDDALARAVHFSSEPRSQELVRRLNSPAGATARLVRLRAALLRALRENPRLEGLDRDFRHLFGSWFNRGFLRIQRIDWSTPAEVLEKIISYEAVHEIRGWDELRRRVAAPDRRLYAFFHPAMPSDPLIFVQVALTADIPDAIGPVLAEDRAPHPAEDARVAAFYSITNCHEGLRGVSFGAFLIKQVVEELSRELPRLRTFVTLSPIPGLRAWLAGGAPELGDEARAAMAAAPPAPDALARAAAVYLAEAKSRGGPLDPVARFHLGNGAVLHRINAEADASERGMAASWGCMVNYLYDLDAIERNHEAFAGEGTIATAPAVRRLLPRR